MRWKDIVHRIVAMAAGIVAVMGAIAATSQSSSVRSVGTAPSRQPVPVVNVTPEAGPSGTAVTISGDGCTGEVDATVALGGGGSVPGWIGQGRGDASGAWSLTGILPLAALPGDRSIELTCDGMSLTSVPFTVLPGGNVPTLRVAPQVVQLGAGAITVVASGDGCTAGPRVGTRVAVELFELIPYDTIEPIDRALVSSDERGTWSATLILPAGWRDVDRREAGAPATRRTTSAFIRAQCQGGDGWRLLFDYVPLASIRVLPTTDGSAFTG